MRRWEKREGLPVDRHRHAALGSVYAFADEIDAWQFGRERPADAVASSVVKPPRRVLVGRDRELRALEAHLSRAVGGTRQVVFVAAELGVGKTALTQTFIDSLPPDVWVAEGQCVQHFGAGEPYLAVIDALERLCRDPSHRDAVKVVETHAPSWLDQINLASRTVAAQPRRRSPETRAERMAGELVETIEALAAARPLVLLLEDLHWSDHSTIELIARLGRRSEAARLLTVGTYRQTELFDTGSPLLRVCRELLAHFQAFEIELGLLTKADVAQLIAREKTWADVQRTAAYLKTGAAMLTFCCIFSITWNASGHVVERENGWALNLEPAGQAIVPSNLRMLVDEQIDRLDSESRGLLEAAASLGEIFPAALVAAAVQEDVSAVERSFEDLCRRSHLVSRRDDAEWPDGKCSASYAFGHDFYRQVVYERLPSATVAEWHRRIGERLEAAYRGRESDVSSLLATHFDRGHDAARAVRHSGLAAENALVRNADRDAQIGLSRATEVFMQLPSGAERDALDTSLHAQWAAVVRKLKGTNSWFDSPVGSLGWSPRQAGDTSPELVDTVISLSRFHSISGDLQAAREIGRRAVAVGRHSNNRFFEAVALQAEVRLLGGEFEAARSLALDALSAADRAGIRASHDGRTMCLTLLAWSTWYIGRYDEARAALRQIIQRSPVEHHAGYFPVPLASVVPIQEWLGDTEQSAFCETQRSTRAARAGFEWQLPNAAYGWLLVSPRKTIGGSRNLAEERGHFSTPRHACSPSPDIGVVGGGSHPRWTRRRGNKSRPNAASRRCVEPE